ncbi:MAG: alpha/beta hydrolase [Candidatus Humimicrobiaceae bacterium]
MKRKFFLIFIILIILIGYIISSTSCKTTLAGTSTSGTTTTALANESAETSKPTETSKKIETSTKIEETSSTKISLPQGEINFKTDDGIGINANIFGNFDRIVILSHMFPTDQTSWFEFAKFLNENNIAALTYDFRGYGKSEGKKDIPNIYKDLEAAVKFISSFGLNSIYLMGASMGGTASIIAAAAEPDISGLITLSAPDEFKGLSSKNAVKDLKCPKLFIAAKDDAYAFKSANFFYDNSNEPKEKLILDGKSHGTFIFNEEPENGNKIREAVILFFE